ncbi:unnamed protein product [Rotaria sp. Silwood1]|nr:unnamed protein product [Rotaria sp. Silwood1]CAF1662831.1 unnamed protein product [Rotaria sp. Silwood1]CAF3904716.1 unnamed protein product [Rotaria sp. Silwood1]CAF3933316.1 unnamed protein product [Rotaria sp. Silwood1]CAF4995782.1 unnamed protein product [Rotaria sp. Silwood1]
MHKDGTVEVINNRQNSFNQGRGINAQPFTSKLGEWRCVGKNQVVISTADYTLQVPGSPVISKLAFLQASLTFTNNGKDLTGTFGYSLYKLGVYPTDPGAQPLPASTVGPYAVTGRRFYFFKR